MSTFPKQVLATTQVKSFRDRVIRRGSLLTTEELLELIGSHEHLRAIALSLEALRTIDRYGAPEKLTRGASYETCAIRIDKDRFALVDRIRDVEGCLPGDTNGAFATAVSASVELNIITEEESKRFFDWRWVEDEKRARDRNLADIDRRAQGLGYRLVKKSAPRPVKKHKRKR